MICFCLVKQKTACEVRISDWSSDVCSSDLDAGRLTHPMRYEAQTDPFVPVSWDEAFARIGAAMQALSDPNEAEFYQIGRASCRVRVCQYGSLSVVAVSLKTK